MRYPDPPGRGDTGQPPVVRIPVLVTEFLRHYLWPVTDPVDEIALGIIDWASFLTVPKLLEMIMQAVVARVGVPRGLGRHPVDGRSGKPSDLMDLPLGYPRADGEPYINVISTKYGTNLLIAIAESIKG